MFIFAGTSFLNRRESIEIKHYACTQRVDISVYRGRCETSATLALFVRVKLRKNYIAYLLTSSLSLSHPPPTLYLGLFIFPAVTEGVHEWEGGRVGDKDRQREGGERERDRARQRQRERTEAAI